MGFEFNTTFSTIQPVSAHCIDWARINCQEQATSIMESNRNLIIFCAFLLFLICVWATMKAIAIYDKKKQ